MHAYETLAARWKALRSRGDVTVREVACVGAPRTILCAQLGEQSVQSVTISAGVHGDEPAGTLALISLVESNELDPAYAYRLWPCTNPSGFAVGSRANVEGADINRSFGRGGQTPEARAILTANRDRKYLISIDLHEDCDAHGFYCYEYGICDLGETIVGELRAHGCPLESVPVLAPVPAQEAEALGGLSYSLSIARHAARRTLTFEAPGRLALDRRIEIHRIAVKAAIAALSKQHSHGATR